MSKLANEVGAINLAQGFPDFSPSTTLMRLVNEAMVEGHNQYAPMPGVPALRRCLSDKISRLYNVTCDPDSEITITAGATQALYTAITALIKKGDEILVIEPCYDSYLPAIELNGGIPVFVKLRAPRFEIDWDEIESKLSSRTSMFIMNTPHNPTGALWTASDMAQLSRLAEKYDFIVLSDEVYEHLVFEGANHETALKYPALKKRSLVCFSFGKVFHNTGWKMGYCVAPEKLTAEFRKVHQFLVFSCNTPVQHALANFLDDPNEYLSLNNFFENKRDVLLESLVDSKFDIIPTAGTYFQLLNYSSISDLDDMSFCERLAREHGVAAIPISYFYHDRHDDRFIRLCFAKSDQTLREAGKLLSNL